jgi:HEPN domain-containing protein
MGTDIVKPIPDGPANRGMLARRTFVAKIGRPPVLTTEKRGQILAILSVGCSQSTAAQYVGCAVSTIQRTADRDPEFAKSLCQAKCNAELGLVKNIRNAAKKEQYWRAAAWALERGFPEKYAPRSPDVITAEQLAEILGQLADRIVEHVPNPQYRKNIVKDIESLARSLGQTIKEEVAEDMSKPTTDETTNEVGNASQ